MTFPDVLVDRLLRSSLEGAVFVLAVAVACRLLPRLRARDRASLWWLAGAKLLLGLLPLAPLALAVLPSGPAVVHAVPASAGGSAEPRLPASHAAAVSPGRDLEWRRLAGLAWSGGVLLLLAASVPGAIRARRWRSRGYPFVDPVVVEAATRAAAGAGLRSVPPVLAVPGLPGPLVAGPLRPSILLPGDATSRMTGDEIEMALAHEMAHVARRDLTLGLVPALARRVFFFHPLAWIVEREYAIAREAACDDAVVARPGADVRGYGRLLLRLCTARPVAAAAAFSPRSMLRRRLEMIESAVACSPLGRTAGSAVLAAAAVLLVPVRLVASERPAAAPPPAERAAARCLDDGGGDTAYVIFDGPRRTACGTEKDLRAAERARKDAEDLVWFRVGDDAWVVRDPETIAQVKALLRPKVEAAAGQASVEAEMARARAEADRGVGGGIGGGVSGGVEGGVSGGVEGGVSSDAARRQIERGLREIELAEEAATKARRDAEAADRRRGDDAAKLAELRARMEALRAQLDALEAQMDATSRRVDEMNARQDLLRRLLDDARKSGRAVRML